MATSARTSSSASSSLPTFPVSYRNSLLQVGVEHRHAHGHLVVRRRRVARDRNVFGRIGVRLAASDVLFARGGDGGRHVCRVVSHNDRPLCGDGAGIRRRVRQRAAARTWECCFRGERSFLVWAPLVPDPDVQRHELLGRRGVQRLVRVDADRPGCADGCFGFGGECVGDGELGCAGRRWEFDHVRTR